MVSGQPLIVTFGRRWLPFLDDFSSLFLSVYRIRTLFLPPHRLPPPAFTRTTYLRLLPHRTARLDHYICYS